MQCVNGSASQTSWADQLDRPAGQTSWTDQLDRPAGRISLFYLKPWPVRLFEDFPFSLYIVAASESDEGLVSIRNRNVPIQSDFKTNTSSEICVCGHSENMKCIYRVSHNKVYLLNILISQFHNIAQRLFSTRNLCIDITFQKNYV